MPTKPQVSLDHGKSIRSSRALLCLVPVAGDSADGGADDVSAAGQ